MSLKYSLLGMIAERPGSGYTLRKRFFSYLKPTMSQVYRTLADMTSEGLADFNKVDQDNAPNKKVYYITEKGKQDLDRWLRDTMPSREWLTQRHVLPYLTQIWFSYRINPEEVIKNLKTYKLELLHRLEWMQLEAAKINKIRKSLHKGRDTVFRDLSIKGSAMELEAIVRWMDYAIANIESLKTADKSGTTTSSKPRAKSS
jgi:PadR family transcriptional regulator AphA